MKTSPKGIALITEFEGFRSAAYQDVVGVWTIGYGFTKGVQPGDTMTKAQAKARLAVELGEYEEGVLSACTNPPNQNEFDALVCFAFNVGVGGMSKSSVIKAHNRGDHQAAARAFSLWVKAGGKEWPGLVRRRAAEAALYLTPMADDVSDPSEGPILEMPQAVEPERKMASSEINKASVAAGGTAAIAAATQSAQLIGDFKNAADSLGNWLVPILLIAVVALCGYVVYMRFKQRSSGWA